MHRAAAYTVEHIDIVESVFVKVRDRLIANRTAGIPVGRHRSGS